jgi:ferredoxin-NADP reductase
MQEGIHYIFIADTTGMASVYPTLKERLATTADQHVTLLYCSGSNQFIFQKELEILQKHYPAQLFVSYHSNALDGRCVFQQKDIEVIAQEDVEVIVNANTMQQMNFIISGNAEFTTKITDSLTFLGIKDIQIHKQYFSE